jgi:hypothetical protein
MSESPFNKHGKAAIQEPRRKRFSLFGGRYETPFLLAHRATNEWRLWREVVSAAETYDPFDLRRLEHAEYAWLAYNSSNPIPVQVLSASPELMGTVTINISIDTSGPEDLIVASLQLEDEQPGDEVTHDYTDFGQGNGQFRLASEGNRHWVELKFISGYSGIFLGANPLRIDAEYTNEEVSIPLVEFGEGR